ncbi:hypothetical protein ACVCNR_14685 [Aquamicrobium terrae]
MTEARTSCINPRCNRTYKQEHEGQEVICGKCFRSLPDAVRTNHRRYWREYRKWDRRIKRTRDELKILHMRVIRDRFGTMIDCHWDAEIKPYFLSPEKPEGLDAFLEEVGL